ncbi:dihydrofolate reductase family protein, partial [Rhizobium hidalgonense]
NDIHALISTKTIKLGGKKNITKTDELKTKKQIYDVLVETGPTLAAEFLKQGLVDELIVYLAPTLLGSTGRAMFNFSLTQMSQQYRLQLQSLRQVGQDVCFILTPKQA